MPRNKEITVPVLTEVGMATCTPKRLHADLRHEAAKTAIEQNPVNSPRTSNVRTFAEGLGISVPQMISILTTKYWGAGGVKLGVSFIDGTSPGLRDLIISHMNSWGDYANVVFAYSQSQGEVRISRGPGGYWSYLGTDILHIPKGQATMNLEGFSLKTPISEYKRVVRHETGHTLGFPHEHMRAEIVDLLDRPKTLAYFMKEQGWTVQEIQDQVLTPLSESSIMGTPVDVDSIMCYQFPGSITRDGTPIPGGTDIDPSDGAFAAKLYPKAPCPTDGTSELVTIDVENKKLTYPQGWTAVPVG